MEVLASTGARNTQLRMVVCLFIASPYLKNALPILRIYKLFIGVYSTDVVSSYSVLRARCVALRTLQLCALLGAKEAGSQRRGGTGLTAVAIFSS